MKNKFTPTYMFATYREVTPEFLAAHGIRALLTDIDNTLAPYEEPEPDADIRAWLEELQKAGVQVALVSNNHAARVEAFNRTLGLPAFPDSHKPRRKMLLRAMEQMGVSPRETAVLGDQLFTDAYAGQHIGLPAIIVPPIRDKTNLFFRCKRLLERPFIRKYAKTHGREAYMKFWKV